MSSKAYNCPNYLGYMFLKRDQDALKRIVPEIIASPRRLVENSGFIGWPARLIPECEIAPRLYYEKCRDPSGTIRSSNAV